MQTQPDKAYVQSGPPPPTLEILTVTLRPARILDCLMLCSKAALSIQGLLERSTLRSL